MSEPSGKGRRRRRRASRSLTIEGRAQRVLHELRALGRQIAERHGVEADEPSPISELVIPVTVDLRKGRAARTATQQLVAKYDERVEQALRGRRAFRPGHVYCFLTDSVDSPHSHPDDAGETFAGYTATGKPTWHSFLNLCLARSEPRVDQLYGEQPEVIALTQLGSELTGQMLPGFGRDDLSFNLLGQVVAGLIPSDLERRRANGHRVALTVQLIETRVGDAPSRLRMNLLGLTREQIIDTAVTHPRGRADRLRQALRVTRERAQALGRRLIRAERKGQRPDVEGEVSAILDRLRADVERIFRFQTHRTQHAEQRHRTGERPTASALRDVREAGEEKFFFDTQRKTIVVIGKRGRAHVFSPEGRHVTSLQLRPGELERKSGRDRWRPLPAEQRSAFREAVG